jgi:beta-galactosidase
MKTKISLFLFILAFNTILFGQEKPKSVRNDLIYPALESVKPFIDFDGKGFIINGKHTFLTSGSIHYPRVPSLLWEDRLLRMKQGGFDAVETYNFWNFHETRENEWDFSGDKDFAKFLDISQKLGMYSIVRVGPYVCAEWDLGGFPIWLKFKPAFNVRTNDSLYLKWNDHWYDKILPIVAKHQIHKGGNVVMVQLENEHPQGWGVVNDIPYFSHLKAQAEKHKIEVPWFFSGLHHGGPPSTNNANTATRTNPWFSTEFWSGWFDAYRTLAEKRLRNIDQATWEIQAHAGGGYNFYMIHGGTNFETWNDNSGAASYDYGTAIGQAGDLRLMYYRMKRANLLAKSFPTIIGNAVNEADSYKDFATGKSLEILGAPKSADGTFVFIRNFSNAEATATYKNGDTFRMSSYGIYPIPVNVTVSKNMKITASTLPVFGMALNENTTTLIVYGQPGDNGNLVLGMNGKASVISTSKAIKANTNTSDAVTLQVNIPANGTEECLLNCGTESVRILAISQDLTLYTWILGDAGKQFVVCGSSFVRNLQVKNNKPSVIIERPYSEASPERIAVYGSKNQSWNLKVNADMSLATKPAPAFSKWQMSTSPETLADFDDSKWLATDTLIDMGADGNISAFAWYRTTINAPAATEAVLKLKYSNNIEVFVNGIRASETKGTVKLNLTAGKNTISIMASHSGRNKEYLYMGALCNHNDKGIFGKAFLEMNGATTELKGWKMRGNASATAPDAKKWTIVSNSFGAPAFYKTTFKAPLPTKVGPNPVYRVSYKGLTRGTMWINGHNLGRYPEKIRLSTLYIPECWLNNNENSLVIFDETGANPSQIEMAADNVESREIIAVTAPASSATPIVVSPEYPARNLPAQNVGNIAFGKPVSASSVAKSTLADAITDGDFNSDWAAVNNEPNQWFTIDLLKSEAVKIIEINWNIPARNYKYTVEASNDNVNWAKIGDHTTAVPTSPDSPSELSRLNLQSEKYRYIKVTINESKSMRVAEMKVFGK